MLFFPDQPTPGEGSIGGPTREDACGNLRDFPRNRGIGIWTRLGEFGFGYKFLAHL